MKELNSINSFTVSFGKNQGKDKEIIKLNSKGNE